MGLGVLVSNKFMNFHALLRPDVKESAFRYMFSCRIRYPGNFSFGIWKRHDPKGMCRWPLGAPTPLQSILWPIIDAILVTFGQMCNFRDPNLVTFYLCMYRPSILNEEHFTFHLQYKHSGTFANRKYEELSYPKNQRMCDPILVSLLKIHSIIVNPVVKMRPHPAAHAHQPLIRKYPPPRL